MLTTKIISSLIGLVLSMPTCLVFVYHVTLYINKALGVTQFEGALATETFYITIIVSPILSLLIGILHFVLTDNSLPGRLIAVEFAFCLIASVFIYYFVR